MEEKMRKNDVLTTLEYSTTKLSFLASMIGDWQNFEGDNDRHAVYLILNDIVDDLDDVRDAVCLLNEDHDKGQGEIIDSEAGIDSTDVEE